MDRIFDISNNIRNNFFNMAFNPGNNIQNNTQINENLFLTPIFSSLMRNINSSIGENDISNSEIDNFYDSQLEEEEPLLGSQNTNNTFLNTLSQLLTNNLQNSNITNLLNRTLNEKAVYKKVLDEKGLEQIKTIKYSEEKFPDDKHCPISFIDFKQGEHICQLPCGHIFHKDSILQWLEKEQARCPVCRHELSSKEIKNEDISQNIISSRPYPRQSFSQLFRNVILEREQRADDEALQRAILESLNDT